MASPLLTRCYASLVQMVVPVTEKQWPSHISGGSCALLLLKSWNSRIITIWWHKNKEFAQKDPLRISVNTSRVLPIRFQGLQRPHCNPHMTTWYGSDIYQLQREKSDLSNFFVNPVLARSFVFPLKSYELKGNSRILVPHDRKFSVKWSWSQLEFVNETLNFRAVPILRILNYAYVRTFPFYSSCKNKISSRIKVLQA